MTVLAKLLCASISLEASHATSIHAGNLRALGLAANQSADFSHPKEADFAVYMHKKGAAYQHGSSEYTERLALFVQRHAMVEEMNSRPDQKWRAALNHFADRTDQELKSLLGYKKARRHMAAAAALRARTDFASEDDERESVSWVSSVASLSSIRDQGECGSCWAVTATTVLDAHSEIYSHNTTFSTQQVVDCVPNPHSCGGTGGCDGATVELAFQYAMLVGLKTPDAYGSYTASDGACDFKPDGTTSPTMKSLTEFPSGDLTMTAPSSAPGLASYGMTGWQRLPSNSYQELIDAVSNSGPVAVTLAANNLFFYGGGIFDVCDYTVNHAVTLVGYGIEGGQKYWHIQNSWGQQWGENGRIRLLRLSPQKENTHCGMDTEPQDGIACEGETEPVRVCGSCGVLFDSIVPLFK